MKLKRALRDHPWLAWALLAVGGAAVSLGIGLAFQAGGPGGTPTEPTADTPPTALHPVTVRPGPETPRVDTGEVDAAGHPVTAACSSCHATATPDPTTREAADLDQFHQGLVYQHGQLSCLSCHNADNYDTLRLADGTALTFPDTMQLCGQCHGPQKRDYDHGSHGGMNGFWDRTKGPRTRNHCVNCHDPHHPKFPLVRPVLPPRDRISVPGGGGGGEAH